MHPAANRSPYPVQEITIDADHWSQFETNGQYHGATAHELEVLRQRFQELTQQMQHGHTSGNEQGYARAARTPTPPSLGSDNPAEYKHVSPMMYTIWKPQIALWGKQVDG